VKYLRNLSSDAHYDAKSRSMRANPHAAEGKAADDLLYAGDNFVRTTGAAVDFNQLSAFVNRASAAGNGSVHAVSNPSEAERLFAQFKEKKAALKKNKKSSVVDRYGGQVGSIILSVFCQSLLVVALPLHRTLTLTPLLSSFLICYQEHMNAPDAKLMINQSEAYVEYSASGDVVAGW
jgi:hypothetical protein